MTLSVRHKSTKKCGANQKVWQSKMKFWVGIFSIHRIEKMMKHYISLDKSEFPEKVNIKLIKAILQHKNDAYFDCFQYFLVPNWNRGKP